MSDENDDAGIGGRKPLLLNRREFSALGVGALLNGSVPGAAQPRRMRKNVLFLMSDQHRPAALSINGNTQARTPNIDAFALSGTRFDHAYCTTPVCVPSRAGLMTGQYAHKTGVVWNEDAWPYRCKTIAHGFRSAGYITALVGKMHFVDAQTHGFDYHLDFNDWLQYLGPKTQLFADEIGNRPSSGSGLPQIDDLWKEFGDPWTGKVVDDGRKGPVGMGGLSRLEEPDHFESFVTRESIRFLQTYSGQMPFFLVCSYLKPHDPMTPAERFYRQFSADQMKLSKTWGKAKLSTVPSCVRELIMNSWITPELIGSAENAKKYMTLYYASLAQMDDNVGQVLRTLRELGLEDDTIVVYASDHGEMLGDHGLWQKTVFYEQSAGVPLMFRVPGLTRPGTRSETPVSLIQLAPTLFDLCDIPSLPQLDGTSLRGDLLAPERTRSTTVFGEYGLHSRYAKAMIRTNEYKYVLYGHDSPDEMFNMQDDPEEMNNLCMQTQFAGKARELREQLLAWHNPS